MAITSRAARTTDLGAGATPDVVGPGSYLRTDRDLPVHGFAPFSSTVERPVPGDVEARTGNPGRSKPSLRQLTIVMQQCDDKEILPTRCSDANDLAKATLRATAVARAVAASRVRRRLCVS